MPWEDSPTWLDLDNLNNGNEYAEGQPLTYDVINIIVHNLLVLKLSEV